MLAKKSMNLEKMQYNKLSRKIELNSCGGRNIKNNKKEAMFSTGTSLF
ncbi:hypothetical protein [Lysinibacillus sp. NPDC086135]